jgi:hypothetical protein
MGFYIASIGKVITMVDYGYHIKNDGQGFALS